MASKLNMSPDKLDGKFTYKENAWFNSLKGLTKNLLISLFAKHREKIKNIIIETGEEKTEGILPVEIPEVLYKIVKFDDLNIINLSGKSNNDIEQAIEFKTYSVLTEFTGKTMSTDLIEFAEKLIQNSTGNDKKETKGDKKEEEQEGEEEEEELEVDTDGCRTILIRFFLNLANPYFIIPNEDVKEKMQEIMRKEELNRRKKFNIIEKL